jgi:hypothetical protein
MYDINRAEALRAFADHSTIARSLDELSKNTVRTNPQLEIIVHELDFVKYKSLIRN